MRATQAAPASGTVTTIVAERLDVALVAGPASAGAAAATLTNRGNGDERFRLVALDAAGTPLRVAVDGDGDGLFDPAHDPLVDDATPALAPGATLALLVLGTPGTGATLAARALTGSGAPGTGFAGAGDGGGDAVVGRTSAAASIALAFPVTAPPTIVETQSVRNDDGGTIPRAGAVVTYTIDVRFTDASPAASVRNPVPNNTRYRPDTLTLDGARLSDAGHVADRLIVVPLGAVAAGAAHRITFQAVIEGEANP